MRHNYDLGSSTLRFVDGRRFRTFLSYDEKMTDEQVREKIREKFF